MIFTSTSIDKTFRSHLKILNKKLSLTMFSFFDLIYSPIILFESRFTITLHSFFNKNIEKKKLRTLKLYYT